MHKLPICLILGLALMIFLGCGYFASNEKSAMDEPTSEEPEEPEPVQIQPVTEPEPDEFVPIDEEPQLLEAPDPDYPEIAKKAGIEGVVWVKVFVDKEGKIRDAIIFKSSGLPVGFDEAALAAAWKRKYRPAMQNNQPVGVWIAYKVEFNLNK